MACKKIIVEYLDRIQEFGPLEYELLLLQIARLFNLDPTCQILKFITKNKEFSITKSFYEGIFSNLECLRISVHSKMQNRPGFDLLLKQYQKFNESMSKTTKRLYENYFLNEKFIIHELIISRKDLSEDNNCLGIILPFLQSLNSIKFSSSNFSKYEPNFLVPEIFGKRSNSLQNRINSFKFAHINTNPKDLNIFSLILPKLNNLQVLDLSFVEDSIDLAYLLKNLKNSQIKALNLSGFDMPCTENIFYILSEFQCLEILELNKFHFSGIDYKYLKNFANIGKFTKLRVLSLRNCNNLGGNDLPAAISFLTGIQKLDLSGGLFYENQLIDFVSMTVSCINISHLYLSKVNLYLIIDLFIDYLHYIPKITHLDISENGLNDEMIVGILNTTTNLELLDISRNELSTDISQFLHLSLKFLYIGTTKECVNISQLNLIEFEIEFQSPNLALDLLGLLKKQTNLKILGLRKIFINGNNIESLKIALQALVKLEIIDLHDAFCEDSYFKSLIESLRNIKELKIIEYSDNMLSPEKMHLLYKINSRNPYFQHSNEFAILKKSGLLKNNNVCDKCCGHCFDAEICEWNRKRNFFMMRIKYQRKFV